MYNAGFSSPMFMTFNQARKLGGNVRKGEKASLSLFYSTLEVEEEGRADTKMIPYAKQNNVFNVDQIDGLPDGFMDKFVASPRLNDLKPCVKAEAFIKNVPTIIKEELCAELTAAFLCPSVGIEPLIAHSMLPTLMAISSY